MTLPIIIRTAASTELGLNVAGASGQFEPYLPLGASKAFEIALVLAAAILLQELADAIRDMTPKVIAAILKFRRARALKCRARAARGKGGAR